MHELGHYLECHLREGEKKGKMKKLHHCEKNPYNFTLKIKQTLISHQLIREISTFRYNDNHQS